MKKLIFLSLIFPTMLLASFIFPPFQQSPLNLNIGGQIYQTDMPSQSCSGTTITGNWDNGNGQLVDLQGCSGNIATVTWTNPRIGNISLEVVQGTTARTVSWPAAVKWVQSVTPVISTANDAIDMVSCFYNGSIYLCNYLNGFN